MKNSKQIIFAFRGDPMCFIHVLLNGIDLHEKGRDGLIILEGEALTLVPLMSQPGHMLNMLYEKAKKAGIIHGACRACSVKLGVDKDIEAQQIPFIDDMSGHPSMAAFIEKGYEVITF